MDLSLSMRMGNSKAATVAFSFAFTDVTGALVGQDYTSNAIVVSNVAPAQVVSITGGTYSKNGGSFTSADGVASNGDTFCVKGQASASLNTAVNVALTIGTASDTYTITSETAAVATLSALTTSVPRGAYSHCLQLRSAYGANPLCDLILNNTTTLAFNANAAGRLDYKAVIAWRDSVDATATIRCSKVYNQGTLGVGATLDALQATDIDRPILEPLNYDTVSGLWPLSFTGYGATTATYQNLFMTVGAGLTHNQGNHDQVVVLDAMTNVALSSTNNLSVQTLGATGGTSNELNLGNHSLASQYGLNVHWAGSTTTFPGTTALVPVNRSAIMEGMSTVQSSLDGITVGVSQARVHLRVNGNDQFMGPIARTSSASTSMRIGSGISGTDTGAGFRWYASLSYNNYIDADFAGNRATLYADLNSMFSINTAYDAQVLVEGSSTPAGYRSNAHGFSLRLKPLLDGTPRVDVVAMAGTSTATMATNAAACAALKIAGFAKYVAVLSGTGRNDINVASPPTAASIYADMKTWVNAHVAAGFTCYVATIVNTQYTAVAQATGDALCAALNVLIRAGSGVDGFTVIDVAALAEAADYTNATYFDPDQIHGNDSTVGLLQAKATLAASVINAYL